LYRHHRLKFYVLISKDVNALQRHFNCSNHNKNDLHIVINSLDVDFVIEAEQFCKELNLEYTITESNGKPGRGKNSVLDVFTQSDYEYAVMIDGDDWLTPHGVYYYKKCAELENPPDVLCLTNQLSLKDGEGIDHLIYAFFTDDPISKIIGDCSLPDRQLWAGYSYYYINQREVMNRVVFLSRRAAQYRFNEDMSIGEDTEHFLRLKHAHFVGDLCMYQKDDRIPTYIYDQRLPGIMRINGRKIDWVKKLNDKFKELQSKGMLYSELLPYFHLEFEENYVPDICGLVPPKLEVVINKYIA